MLLTNIDISYHMVINNSPIKALGYRENVFVTRRIFLSFPTLLIH